MFLYQAHSDTIPSSQVKIYVPPTHHVTMVRSRIAVPAQVVDGEGICGA